MLFYHTQVNFLAHVFLANGEPDAIVGQLCGDFVRGSQLHHYPQAIVHGIQVHRAVDSYTDQHPLNREARELFESPHRRYAGIICDVVYDHFLALDWDQYSDVPLADYAALVDESLQNQTHVLPERLRNFMPYLRSEKILQSNTDQAHIELTLKRISARRKSMAPLATASESLWQNREALHQIFNQFFPELINHTRQVQQQVRTATPSENAADHMKDHISDKTGGRSAND